MSAGFAVFLVAVLEFVAVIAAVVWFAREGFFR